MIQMQVTLAELWVGYPSPIFHQYYQLLHNDVMPDEKQ